MKNNKFVYETESGTTKGFFNVYQGKNGKIYLMMGKSITALTKEQVTDLNINVYGLKDFNYDDFLSAYDSSEKDLVRFN